MVDGFLELRIGFAAQRSIALKLFDIQIVRFQQLVSRSIEGVGVFEQLTIAFQGQGPASLDLCRSRAFFHDRNLVIQRFLFIGCKPQGNRTCRTSPGASSEGLWL